MDFKISCEQFARLSNASYQLGERLPVEQGSEQSYEMRPSLACVRLEHRAGKTYAIASCAIVMAIEYLGTTTQPDGFVNITNDAALVKQCINETALGSDLMISSDPVSGFTMLMSTMGFVYTSDANIRKNEAWQKRDWMTMIVEPPSKSDTAFVFGAEWIARLGRSAPSGNFTLPKHVLRNQPIAVRDRIDQDWLGLFLVPKAEAMPHAVLPAWVKS